jgi:hypothetical protein
MAKRGRGKLSLRETIDKKYPEFAGMVDGLALSDLEAKISTYAKEAEKVKDAKKVDEALISAKNTVTEYAGPYNDASTAINLKIRYLISLVKEKGGDA